MLPTEEDVAPHMAQFIAMLDAAFESYRSEDGLPANLRDAVQATPRHSFVHRFRVGSGPLLDLQDDPARHLPTIYSDEVMRHVDADGASLPSTNSQPSFVLWLLHMLDLRPGQRVLEIGSGSGWLAAVMAHLVGSEGHVTGIEIIPELAAQSRTDLAALGLANVTILTQDGTTGHSAGAPFDRVMITAGTWDVPPVLFHQVADHGRVLVPIELRGTGGCQVTLLRRTGAHFVAGRSIAGWFVPLIGTGQERTGIHRTLENLPFWAEIAAMPTGRFKLPLGVAQDGHDGSAMREFRAFLGRTELGFAVFEGDALKDARTPKMAGTFGLVDETAKAVALCTSGELIGYGGCAAIRRLARAFARWAAFGLPGMAAFGLEVWRIEAAPPATNWRWVERRDETALVWSLRPDATAWRSLLDDVEAGPTGPDPSSGRIGDYTHPPNG
jgi:protein-L-isoaspartate(D-aspartate) O-methyltransferase